MKITNSHRTPLDKPTNNLYHLHLREFSNIKYKKHNYLEIFTSSENLKHSRKLYG